MNKEFTFTPVTEATSLPARVRRVGSWVLQGYCRQEHMVLDGGTVHCYPQGSMRTWRVTAQGYRCDGSVQMLDAEVKFDQDGQMRAWTPGYANSASFDPAPCFALLNEERPMNLACTLARLPVRSWDDVQKCWDEIDKAKVNLKAVQERLAEQPSNHQYFLRGVPAQRQDGSMPPSAEFSEVL